MGIRKKVTIGFVSLALLLMGAGAVSFFELSRIGKRTQEILEASNRNMSISREMLDGAEMQHLSLLHNYGLQGVSTGYDSLYLAGRKMLTEALVKGREAGETAMDGIEKALADYEDVTRSFFFDTMYYESDWLKTRYWSSYMELTSAIKSYMTGAEYNLGTRAGNIERNAYRAITPSLVTLAVIMLLLFVLLYFIDLYYMRPVVKMNKSLGDWIKYNSMFNVTFEGKDEVYGLKENIEKLIDRVKRTNPKPE